MGEPGSWITIEAERALYVDRGATAILCDRLPDRPTLVVRLTDAARLKLVADLSWETPDAL